VKREYKIVLLTYLIMQLSSPVGVPFTYYLLNGLGFSGKDLESRSLSLWLLFSFSAAFIVTLYCLRREMRFRSQKAASFPVSAFWAAAGVFLALFGQLAAARIEMLFGVEPGSENTREIIGMIEKAPAIFLVAAVFGPILEEVVFRKIIFGTCMQRLGFFSVGADQLPVFFRGPQGIRTSAFVYGHRFRILLCLPENEPHPRPDFFPCVHECDRHSFPVGSEDLFDVLNLVRSGSFRKPTGERQVPACQGFPDLFRKQLPCLFQKTPPLRRRFRFYPSGPSERVSAIFSSSFFLASSAASIFR